MVSGGTSRVWWRAAVALAAFAVVATGLGAGPRSGDASAYKAPESAVVPQADKAPESAVVPQADKAPESAVVPQADKAPESAVVPEADEASDSDEAPEADDASCDETFTYWDGDAERTVSLCDEIPDDSGGGDRDDFRGGRADPVGAGCASGASDGDGLLFRSEQGVEMTLTHSVVLVLDPGWGDTQVRRFLARNRIPPSCASPLGWLPNGFAIATGPGIAALELANQLAPQHGVVLSSPNWASEVEVKTESDSSTPVSAPTITALHPSDRSITVVWEPPSDLPDGVDVTYEIAWIASNKAGRADARWWTTRGIGGSSRHYLLQPFREGSGEEPTNGVRYSVKVRAVTDKPGRWSRVVAATPFERSGLSIGGSWPSTPFDVPIGGFQDAKPDLDVFKIEIAARTGVLVRTGGSVENTSCSIYNAERDQVEGTRTHRSGGYPGIQGQCMVYAILDPGDWYLTVNGFGWQSSPLHHGSYTVQIESVAPTGQSLESALAAVQGERRYGFIGRDPGEADVWRLDVAGREFIDVHIENLYNGIKASLHDSTGEPVEVIVTPLYTLCSVRGCTGFNTRVRAELAAGTYYLKIRSEDEWSASYTLMRHIDHHYRNLVTLCEGLERAEGVDDLLGGCQWHLDSRGQRGASVGEDANVAAAHRAGYLGEGVHVAVVDTGIDLGHDDLSANTDPTRSRAYCGSDTAPHSSGFNHGTAVAGVVAARDNQIGMRGVAPRATLHNRRLLGDGCEVTAENVADAMTASMADICVNTNSWGWYDGVSASPSALLFDLAIDRGVTAGCGGKGISYVWSAGNGHRFGDDSNLSEYTNHYGVMSVCAVNAHGLRSVYSEHGANLWVCGPSNDRGDGIPGVATTTNHDRYRTDFGGTSAAAPIVAGVAALVRGANSELTWRDVKLILAGSARQNYPGDSSWRKGAVKWGETGERYRHSREYGFGVVDAKAAVDLAKEWTNLPPMITQTQTWGDGAFEIPVAPGSVSKSVTFDDAIEFVEFVQIDTSFSTDYFRDLRIELVSPSGTEILVVPSWSSSPTPLNEAFRFGVAGLLGEPAEGPWTLKIGDRISGGGETSLDSWGITLYGHRLRPTAPTLSGVEPGPGSLAVSWSAPSHSGASGLTGYELRHIAADEIDRADSQWTEVEVPGGAGAVGYTIESLLPGARDVQVRAISGEVAGVWSAAVSGTPGPESNTEPAFAADSVTLQIAENSAGGTSVGEPVVAVDGDEGAELVYSLSGTDAAGFAVDSATGQISVSGVLDYEAPADSDSDNAYELVVWVSDGRGDKGVVDTSTDDSVAVTVEVADVNEPLVLVAGECTVEVVDSDSDGWECGFEASDPEGAVVVWWLSGDDAALFGIGGGVLGLVEAADAGAPGDSDGDGVYEVTVEAAAGGHSASADVSLAVVAPNRAPVFAGTLELTNNAPPGYLVSLTLFRSDFTDPDGDPLTFEISTSRDDVVASGGITHVERFGRLFFVAKTACALLELDPEPGEVYETTVTTTATDPDGATASATRIFRTDPTWSNSTESLEDDCPQATGAQVDGATLVISLDGAVAISIEPPTPAEFAVTADGAAVSVASVRAPGRYDTTITLELASPVTQGQAVTVSYAPGDYAIAAAFADQPATNNTQPPPAPVCVTAPEGATAPTCAAVSGNDLIVTFNADLAPIDAATASALRFSFFVDGAYHNGAPVNFQSPGRVSVDGAALTLTLGTAVRAGDEVTIHYSASSAGNGLNDADGNPIPDFTLTVTTTAQS